MIAKYILIEDSGITPFYLSRDNVNVDLQLFAGMCSAIYSFSVELNTPFKAIEFEGKKLIMQKYETDYGKSIMTATLFDNYNIEEGVRNKNDYLFNKYFKNLEFINNERINNQELDSSVTKDMDDAPLKNHLEENYEWLYEDLDELIMNTNNGVSAYSLNSSTNNVLKCNCNKHLMHYRNLTNLNEEDLQDVLKFIIQEYLQGWNIQKIPQGDKFTDDENPEGLDLPDYSYTGTRTNGVLINLAINWKEEPSNEVLLYLFGKNTLMRSLILEIENSLRIG